MIQKTGESIVKMIKLCFIGLWCLTTFNNYFIYNCGNQIEETQTINYDDVIEIKNNF